MIRLLTVFFLFSHLAMAQHSIVLKNNDKLEGVVLSLNNDVLVVYVDGKEKSIPLKEVSSLFFNEYVPYDGALLTDGEEIEIKADGFKVTYKIKDRKLIKNPTVSLGSEDKGVVVVKITVDRYGNIKSAEPGAPGSTTSSNYLNVKAQRAAKSAKFDENLKGPLTTEGTMTFYY